MYAFKAVVCSLGCTPTGSKGGIVSGYLLGNELTSLKPNAGIRLERLPKEKHGNPHTLQRSPSRDLDSECENTPRLSCHRKMLGNIHLENRKRDGRSLIEMG
jgi:hypothetical protein